MDKPRHKPVHKPCVEPRLRRAAKMNKNKKELKYKENFYNARFNE